MIVFFFVNNVLVNEKERHSTFSVIFKRAVKSEEQVSFVYLGRE